MKGGRALQFGRGLPARDWFDCVCTFTHMRNRLPDAHSAEPGKRLTPYELFEDKAVPLAELMEHWLVIGCLCYVVISPNSRARQSSWDMLMIASAVRKHMCCGGYVTVNASLQHVRK